MSSDPPSPPTDRPRNWGGRRAGAGAPRGPRRATVERQTAIDALFDDPHERALLARLAPLDIIEVAARRLLADGNFYAAAHLATLAAPYRHTRKRTIVTDAAGRPLSPPPVRPAGVEPELLRKLDLTPAPAVDVRPQRSAFRAQPRFESSNDFQVRAVPAPGALPLDPVKGSRP